jgi:hypothetical protein
MRILAVKPQAFRTGEGIYGWLRLDRAPAFVTRYTAVL